MSANNSDPGRTKFHSSAAGVPKGGEDTGIPSTFASTLTFDPPAGAPTVGGMFGPYELLGEVARGGMGIVYRARQQGLDRVVALKMVLGPQLDSKMARERFIEEARAAAALDHPNVLPIYDIGEVDGRLYFTMAFVDGPNLKAYAESVGQLAVSHALSVFLPIVAGVAHAHACGIVHRDLKPANVLIDPSGRPRVTDFGLAKRSARDSELTGTGQVMGTPAYMAPEQARNSKDVGPAADVYSLGAILYYMLAGKPPFTGDSVAAILIKAVTEPPPPLRESNPDVPADVEAIVLRCLAKEPADRYRDAGALEADLLPLTDRLVPRSSSRVMALPPHRPSDEPSRRSGLLATQTQPPLPAADRPSGRRLAAGLLAAVALVAAGVTIAVYRAPAPVSGTGSEVAAGGAVPVEDGWPDITRRDFGLKVEIIGPTTPGADGSLRLPVGKSFEVLLHAERDCNVAVYVVETNGNILRILPNNFEGNTKLSAGVTRVLPGDKSYAIEATPTIGAGFDRIRVVATTGTLPTEPAGQKTGAFVAFTKPEDCKRIAAAVRGLRTRGAKVVQGAAGGPQAAEEKVSEAEVKFRVGK